jgi:hypothetical protein
VRADRWKGLGEGSELRKAMPVQCTGILRIAMFTCGQFRRAAADRITQRRMRIAVAVLLIALVCVTIAVVL